MNESNTDYYALLGVPKNVRTTSTQPLFFTSGRYTANVLDFALDPPISSSHSFLTLNLSSNSTKDFRLHLLRSGQLTERKFCVTIRTSPGTRTCVICCRKLKKSFLTLINAKFTIIMDGKGWSTWRQGGWRIRILL